MSHSNTPNTVHNHLVLYGGLSQPIQQAWCFVPFLFEEMGLVSWSLLCIFERQVLTC